MEVPVKFVVGDLDMVYTTPGAKEFVNNGGFKHHAIVGGSCCDGRSRSFH